MNSFAKNKYLLLAILIFSIWLHNSCKNRTTTSIKVYAATGASQAVNELCNFFEENNKEEVQINCAASGTLARQIKGGAEADIYISANKQWVDYLLENELLLDTSIDILAKNNLVFVAAKGKAIPEIRFAENFNIAKLARGNIAIGDFAYVPAGKYAKQVLDSLNWYRLIEDKLILCKDVSSALHLVELGECDLGIVYLTEAKKSDKVQVICEVPEELHEPIHFYIALVNGCTEDAWKLYQFFKSSKSKEIFTKYRFEKE